MDHLDREHDSEDEGMEDYKIGGDFVIRLIQDIIQFMLEKSYSIDM